MHDKHPPYDVPIVLQVFWQHLDGLQSLWGQRVTLSRSTEWTSTEWQTLEERIAAHLDGLLLHGEQVVPRIQPGLEADEWDVAFAAAYLLLALRVETAAKSVMAAFREAAGERLAGFRLALCHGVIDLVRPQLAELVATGNEPVCVAAAEALAFQGQLEPRLFQWRRCLQDKDAEIRKAAWRVVALVDG